MVGQNETDRQRQRPFNGLWSGTTRAGRYQKCHHIFFPYRPGLTDRDRQRTDGKTDKHHTVTHTQLCTITMTNWNCFSTALNSISVRSENQSASHSYCTHGNVLYSRNDLGGRRHFVLALLILMVRPFLPMHATNSLQCNASQQCLHMAQQLTQTMYETDIAVQ